MMNLHHKAFTVPATWKVGRNTYRDKIEDILLRGYSVDSLTMVILHSEIHTIFSTGSLAKLSE